MQSDKKKVIYFVKKSRLGGPPFGRRIRACLAEPQARLRPQAANGGPPEPLLLAKQAMLLFRGGYNGYAQRS